MVSDSEVKDTFGRLGTNSRCCPPIPSRRLHLPTARLREFTPLPRKWPLGLTRHDRPPLLKIKCARSARGVPGPPSAVCPNSPATWWGKGEVRGVHTPPPPFLLFPGHPLHLPFLLILAPYPTFANPPPVCPPRVHPRATAFFLSSCWGWKSEREVKKKGAEVVGFSLGFFVHFIRVPNDILSVAFTVENPVRNITRPV